MTEWNDDRLDEFRERVDEGFAKVDRRFDAVDRRFDAIDKRFKSIEMRFDTLNERFDGFYRVLIQGTVAMTVGILGLLGVLVGLVVTQA